jgi:hypothetical protein
LRSTFRLKKRVIPFFFFLLTAFCWPATNKFFVADGGQSVLVIYSKIAHHSGKWMHSMAHHIDYNSLAVEVQKTIIAHQNSSGYLIISYTPSLSIGLIDTMTSTSISTMHTSRSSSLVSLALISTHQTKSHTLTPGRCVSDPFSFNIAPLILSPIPACRLWWTTGSAVRLLLPQRELLVVRPVVVVPAVWRGSTVVVVLTVRLLALRPRRRVISVGFVVRVSTMLLRLVGMLVLFWGLCFGLICGWLCSLVYWKENS